MQGSVSRSPSPGIAIAVLAAILCLASLLSLTTGAVGIRPDRALSILWSTLSGNPPDGGLDATVVLDIRLPRLVVGALVGAALAVSGALLQGIFRNPLADPGIIGISSGSALAAAATIVLGDRLLPEILRFAGPFLLAASAFFGGLGTMALLYRISTRAGRTSVAVMVLAGVALAALSASLTGLLVFISDDRQLRDLSFWMLGSLGGSTWPKARAALLFILPCLVCVPFLARALNALALGEAEAFYIGVPVQRTKQIAIAFVSLAVGTSVALTGPIGFVGIIVPHLLRLTVGANHRFVLPASALLGASLLVSADVLARIIAKPAEVPIGILTAAIGAPFFLWLLLTRLRSFAT